MILFAVEFENILPQPNTTIPNGRKVCQREQKASPPRTPSRAFVEWGERTDQCFKVVSLRAITSSGLGRASFVYWSVWEMRIGLSVLRMISGSNGVKNGESALKTVRYRWIFCSTNGGIPLKEGLGLAISLSECLILQLHFSLDG